MFADSGGVGTALADRAAAAGTRVLEVVAGTELRREGRRLVIDPRDPGHYAEVFAAADGDGPLHVAHLWSLLADDPHAAVGHGFDSLLLAVQAIGDRAVRLLTVTRGPPRSSGRTRRPRTGP